MIKEFSINDKKDRIVEAILEEKPEVIAFSTYIWNLDYVREISELIKLIHGHIEILYGGPEVSYDSEEFLTHNAGDYVIEGEGEKTYREFIEYKLGMKEIKDIKGLYCKEKSMGNIMYHGKRELMDMNEIIFPYAMNENLSNKIIYYEASRGCPFNCKYCLSSTIHGVRFLEVNRVKKELQFFIDKGVKLIKFVDRTFNCNSRFAMEIWKFLIDQNTDTTFHFEISADILTEEEIKLLSKAPLGRFQFEVGVQTTNDEVLKNINRRVNFKDIKEKVCEMEKIKNIKQHLDLIAGLPGEDYESFKKSFNQVYSIRPEEIQLGFLKLLKGSSMRKEAEFWGMVYSPYPPYEILKTKDMSYEEIRILKKVENMVDKYYNSQKFNTIIKYCESKFSSAYDFFFNLAMFFDEKGYFEKSISSVDYYKVFLEFNEEIIKDDSKILKEIIKYDYLNYNKKKWIPEFLHRDIKGEEKKVFKEYLSANYPKNNNYHIEKYDIDVECYINHGEILEKSIYLLYNEKEWNDIKNITERLVNSLKLCKM